MALPPPGPDVALLTLLLAGGRVLPRRLLLDRHLSPETALGAGEPAWRAAGCSDAQVERLRCADANALESALDWLTDPNHHLVGWHAADYPPLLRRIANPPLALFIDGDPSLLWHPGIAIVGTRSPTAGGQANAQGFARTIADKGIVVASGMAAGIDTTAHLAALDRPGGRTVAVLGTGTDIAYPRSNRKLRARIAECGALVSEHPPGTAPLASHFPARNRILAGLALGTVVIEAAERSGALITARLAAESGREVFAVPGSIHNPMARGCHRLIREGASLVQGADEVLDGVAMLSTELASALRERLAAPIQSITGPAAATPASANPDYQRLWLALGHDPIPMDSLVQRTGLTAAALSSMLLLMELDGSVTVEHGRYTRTN